MAKVIGIDLGTTNSVAAQEPGSGGGHWARKCVAQALSREASFGKCR